jgi:hypothetical protein
MSVSIFVLEITWKFLDSGKLFKSVAESVGALSVGEGAMK